MKKLLLGLAVLTATLVPGGVAHASHTDSGYWMLTEDGQVFAFGGATRIGQPGLSAGKAIDIEPTPSGHGYWVLTDDATLNYGDAGDYRLPTFLDADEKVVSISSTPSGDGYWLFTDKGRVFARGEAGHFGDMSGKTLNGPVLDSVATPSGQGYWMVASDGGVFSFGDAKFYGSMGGTKLNKPVQSLAPDPDGVGYWLVASDGGIFAFDAGFHGSMGGTRLNRPVTGMVGGRGGYLMVAEDGGIFAFGETQFHGSLGSNPPASPVVAVAVIEEPDGFGDGTYLVGTEIAPGTYRTTTSPEGCYWARLSGTSGELSDIIANEFGDGWQVVTISPTDKAFETDGCATWTDVLEPVTSSRTEFGQGTMIVGLDLEPGTYRAAGGSGCYWARLSGFGGTLDDIIANDFGSTQPTVTISVTDQGFESSDCGTWAKIG